MSYNTNYPSIDDLIRKAKKQIPRFAFEYLDGGCNEDINLIKNTAELREVELRPTYLSEHISSDMKTELFGHVYDAPFGIALSYFHILSIIQASRKSYANIVL